MGLASRSWFLRQTAFAAAAFYSYPIKAMCSDRAAVNAFATQIAGRVITPDSPEYESSRSIFNRAYDLRPALIVRCANASDVARTLDYAQRQNLVIAVHGGGHSRLGYGMCDNGVVVDLSAMKNVNVDADRRAARVEAGALVRDLDAATQRFGLATTSGGCSTVGVAGLTVGGGQGRLMEKFGAACDNLTSARVVTVDGRQLEASRESNPDLFWAIRGGGGNFGVVTTLEYELHPVGDVTAGPLLYRPGSLPDFLQAFTAFLERAPDEMDANAQVIPSQSGPLVRVTVCYCGEPRMANDFLAPLRALKPQVDEIKLVPYLAAQSSGGFLLAPVAHFQTNLFIPKLNAAAAGAIATAIEHAPPTCKLIVVPLRGAISRVPLSDTAFALRQPGFEVDIAGVWKTGAERAASVRWVESTRDNLWPFATGVYVNQLGDTSDQLVRMAYGPNYARLAEIKQKYDPNDVLRLNQNIRPSRVSQRRIETPFAAQAAG